MANLVLPGLLALLVRRVLRASLGRLVPQAMPVPLGSAERRVTKETRAIQERLVSLARAEAPEPLL